MPEIVQPDMKPANQQGSNQMAASSQHQLPPIVAPTKPPPIGSGGWRRISSTEYRRIDWLGPSKTERFLVWDGQHWVKQSTTTVYNPATGRPMPKLGPGEAYMNTAAGLTIVKGYAGGSGVSSTAAEISRANPTLGDARALALAQTNLPKAEIQAYVDKELDFYRSNIQLADGKWVSKENWAKVPEKYQTIAMTDGYEAMKTAIENDNRKGLLADQKPKALTPIEQLAGRKLLGTLITAQEVMDAPYELTILTGRAIQQIQDTIKDVPGVNEKIRMGVQGGLTGLAGIEAGILTMPGLVISSGLSSLTALTQGKFRKAGETAVLVPKGIVGSFTGIAKDIGTNPYYGIPEAIPMAIFLITPVKAIVKTGIKVAKSGIAYASPAGIPTRAAAIEVDVARVPWKEVGYENGLKVIGEAIQKQLETLPINKTITGKVNVELAGKTFEVSYRRTPLQTEMPDVWYHAAADATPILKELAENGKVTIKGELYTSPQAAMDFLRRSASGVAPVNPGIIAIRASDLKGARLPFKEYKGAIENEIVVKEGMELRPTDPNWYSRATRTKLAAPDNSRATYLTKPLTGKTFTQYQGATETFTSTVIDGKVVDLAKSATINEGQFVPTYWLKTAGAKTGAPSIGQVYAASGLALLESIKDLPYQRLRKIQLSFYGETAEGALSPFYNSRKAYGKIKAIGERLETNAARELKRVADPKWSETAKARAYTAIMDRLTFEELNRSLSKKVVKEALRENRDNFPARYNINLRNALVIAAMGSRARLPAKSLRATRPDIISSYQTEISPHEEGYASESKPPRDTSNGTRAPSETIGRVESPSRLPPSPPSTPPSTPPTIPPSVPPREPPPREPPPPRRPPPPKSPPRRRTIQERLSGMKARRQDFAGAIGWKQGFVVYALKEPYRSQTDVGIFSAKNPPPGMKIVDGPGSAYRTIQTITGRPPDKLAIDMGIMDVIALKGKRLKFRPDLEQMTAGDIVLGSPARNKRRQRYPSPEALIHRG